MNRSNAGRSVFQLLLSAAALAILILGSCERPEEAPIRLTTSERIRIDTLVNLEIDTLRPVMDSICEVRFDEMVSRALDSIIEVRKREEALLRARIQREQEQAQPQQ